MKNDKMMRVRLLSYRDKDPEGFTVINVTSRSNTRGKELSPFFLGPVDTYENLTSQNVENAWQFSKVYAENEDHVDENGDPTEKYFEWAIKGWNDTRAYRYPMGKGAKPLYSFWDGEKLGYVEARKKIYIPLYEKAVLQSDAWTWLYQQFFSVWTCSKWPNGFAIRDFDVYDRQGKSWDELINDETKKFGHGFVLAEMLEEKFSRW